MFLDRRLKFVDSHSELAALCLERNILLLKSVACLLGIAMIILKPDYLPYSSLVVSFKPIAVVFEQFTLFG